MADDGDGGTTFTISGGPGRVEYTLAEIEASSRGIWRVGEDVREIAGTLGAELQWLEDFAAGMMASSLQGANFTQYAARTAVMFLRSAQWSAQAAAQGVSVLAQHASAAVLRYEEAEAATVAQEKAKKFTAVNDGMQASMMGILAPLKMWGQAHELWSDVGREGLRDKVEDMLNDGPAYVAGLLGPGVGLAYLLAQAQYAGRGNSGVWPAYGARKFFDWSGLSKPGHLEMRRVPTGEWNGRPEEWRPGHAVLDPSDGVHIEVNPQVAGLLAGSEDAYGYPPGSIVVDRLERGDGSRAWIVHLPGTEDWSRVDSENPLDLEGDLEGMTATQQAMFKQQQIVVQEMMRQALQDAGALPSEDVMITGHSGGGIHAAAAAANPAFLADVNVRMIIIAGAPARNQPVASRVQVLDLENEHDIVTATDYGPPPDAANWVTVTSHRPGATDGKGVIEVVKDAHDLGNYVDDAAALEGSGDPGVKGAREAVARFMGAGIASGGPMRVARTVYQGRDVNDPEPEKPKEKIDRQLRRDRTK